MAKLSITALRKGFKTYLEIGEADIRPEEGEAPARALIRQAGLAIDWLIEHGYEGEWTDKKDVGKAAEPLSRTATPTKSRKPTKTSSRRDGFGKTAPEECPGCGGEMWDNSKVRTGNQPIYKCKDRNCGRGIWPDEEEEEVPFE